MFALIASLLCLESKQSIRSKTGAIKCCKERTITAPPNQWCNIPFVSLKATSFSPCSEDFFILLTKGFIQLKRYSTIFQNIFYERNFLQPKQLAANTYTLHGIPTSSTHHLGIQFSFRYFLDCIVLLILQNKHLIILLAVYCYKK